MLVLQVELSSTGNSIARQKPETYRVLISYRFFIFNSDTYRVPDMNMEVTRL